MRAKLRLLIPAYGASFSRLGEYIKQSLAKVGIQISPASLWHGFWSITISQTAPVLPYLIMVLILIARPRGLMGRRES